MSAPDRSIEDVIDREMPASGAPGLAYAVVVDGEITSAGARGVVRQGGEKAVTPDTAFLTGSISKSFTALAVMQLVEAGEIQLDAEVSRYLDGFSNRAAGDITVRQLLSHTSGYSTLQGNASHTDSTGGTDELARGVDQLANVAPAHAAKESWEYSNTNYQILGRVVEVVSGKDYQTYVSEHVLEPIGMKNSFVADGEVHPSMATGHRPWFGTEKPFSENTTQRGTAPQGGVVASANDLARYLQTMMNGHDDVLSAEGKSLMMRPASAASPSYGLGWFVDSSNGTVWHSGTSPGYETLATMMPSEEKAVVVLVNAGSGIGFGETTQLRNSITAAALGLDYDGEGSRLFQKALFLSLVLLPFVYALSMIWAWRLRADIRAKSGVFGLFSLWFPLLTTLAAAWILLYLVPTLFGTPLDNIRLFQPDLGIALTATAVTGVLWAVFRLAVAYTGSTGTAWRASPTGGDARS
jgi:CubicO group peptidase (beta-lactamase class C family)